MCVFLECHVLHYRRQLKVVSDEDDSLQATPGGALLSIAAVGHLRVLKQHRDEGLDLQDLSSLLHHKTASKNRNEKEVFMRCFKSVGKIFCGGRFAFIGSG